MTFEDMQSRPTRLQIGASRLELLPDEQLRVFLDPSWLHLGDAADTPSTLKRLVRAIRSRTRRIRSPESLYAKTNFLPFYWKGADDVLPFPSGSFRFAYSEHFFEHLFFDEALALFGECRRVLVPGAVLRICVPDADLRTYERPEPAGYPSRKLPFDHPNKHKTRWNVYVLSEALRWTGFEPVPLVYCDRHGQLVNTPPVRYADSPEPELVSSFRYVRRPLSLIIDGVAKGVS